MGTSAIDLVSYLNDTRSKLANATLPEINRIGMKLICEMLERSLEEVQEVERAAETNA